MSQESLKKRFLNIRSLSEGTPGMSLQAQTKQHDLNKIHEPTHNIETKKVSVCSIPSFQSQVLKVGEDRGYLKQNVSLEVPKTLVYSNTWIEIYLTH